MDVASERPEPKGQNSTGDGQIIKTHRPHETRILTSAVSKMTVSRETQQDKT